jgi:hypothetical protein
MAQTGPVWDSSPGLAPLAITLSKQPRRLEMTAARIADDRPAELDQPNKIEPGELASWPANRGGYVPETWDSQYQVVMSCGPANAPTPLVLLAKAGQGTYVYVALDADEAIAGMYPGAFRLISNLLGLPKNKRTPPSAGNLVK